MLVTGSAGFLGSAVCARLCEREITTIGVDPLQSGSAAFQSFADDLSDTRRIAEYLSYYRVTHIVHCGGISSPLLGTPEEIVAVNTGGSINLALAACTAGVQGFVFASSIAAMQPRNEYGCSKAATELALQALVRQQVTQFCTLRLGGIYGPGRTTPVLPHELVAAALDGTSAQVSARAVGPYIYIDDAVEAVIKACFATGLGRLPYAILHPERVTALQLAQTVRNNIPSFRFEVSENAVDEPAPHFDTYAASSHFDFNAITDHRSGIASLIAWMSASKQPARHAKSA
ncbi:MAG TPA: NAD(P)-dependent oxidoreductase [Xanthobacteraceae bacterium]|nr:NAD(P)-dependent oxidoreductase [Xanthobacteraceae bacterium]